MLKTRFPFIYASTSLDTNRNFESCLSIRCLAPQHIFRFFHFCCSFFSAFGNFAYNCIVLLNTPLIGRDKKKNKTKQKKQKKASAIGYFSRKIFIHRHQHHEVPLSLWFAVSGGEIISWRGMSCLRTFMSKNLVFDFGRNTTTLREFIGYSDLTDFRPISSKNSRNNDKGKCIGKF